MGGGRNVRVVHSGTAVHVVDDAISTTIADSMTAIAAVEVKKSNNHGMSSYACSASIKGGNLFCPREDQQPFSTGNLPGHVTVFRGNSAMTVVAVVAGAHTDAFYRTTVECIVLRYSTIGEHEEIVRWTLRHLSQDSGICCLLPLRKVHLGFTMS